MGLKKLNKQHLLTIIQETNEAVEIATIERCKSNKGNIIESNEIEGIRKIVQETIFKKLVEENDRELFEEEEED